MVPSTKKLLVRSIESKLVYVVFKCKYKVYPYVRTVMTNRGVAAEFILHVL